MLRTRPPCEPTLRRKTRTANFTPGETHAPAHAHHLSQCTTAPPLAYAIDRRTYRRRSRNRHPTRAIQPARYQPDLEESTHIYPGETDLGKRSFKVEERLLIVKSFENSATNLLKRNSTKKTSVRWLHASSQPPCSLRVGNHSLVLSDLFVVSPHGRPRFQRLKVRMCATEGIGSILALLRRKKKTCDASRVARSTARTQWTGKPRWTQYTSAG